jgi:hypothetical protein
VNQTIAQAKALRQTIERRHHDDGKKARCTYAACTIKDRTRLVRNGGWAQESMAALGWTTLSVEGENALMLAPEGMQ